MCAYVYNIYIILYICENGYYIALNRFETPNQNINISLKCFFFILQECY